MNIRTVVEVAFSVVIQIAAAFVLTGVLACWLVWSGLRSSGRRFVGMLALVAVLASCVTVRNTEPLILDISSDRSIRALHQCVTEQIVDSGYAIVETSRDNGVLRAELYRTIPGNGGSYVLRDVISVLIFERTSGTTSIQYRANTFNSIDGIPNGPSEVVTAVAHKIRQACQRP